jgi:hypothetical protein
VVLGRDRVARLRHLYGVPRIHNVETSIGCGGAGRSTGSSDCDKRSLPEGRRCPNRRLRPRSIGWDAGISNSATSRFVCAGNTASTRPSEVSGGLPPGRAPLETRLLGWGGKASRGYRVCAAHSMDGGPEHKQQPAHLWGEARPKMQLEVWTMHWATLLPCDV